jgi:protoporphyrinogen oxidase
LAPQASVAAAIDQFVTDAGLSPADARRARQALRAVIEAEAADLSERQSLRWLWNETEYGGDYFGDLPAGGYRQLVEALAFGLAVRLGVTVDKVQITPSGAVVYSTEGTPLECSHVVVTVPLGVLKAGTPVFSPALPADRLTAIQRLGFGRYEGWRCDSTSRSGMPPACRT